MKVIRFVITWLYLRIVFLPLLKKAQNEENSNVIYLPRAVDHNWARIESAMLEKRYNTLH